jgi:hypothetical protein
MPIKLLKIYDRMFQKYPKSHIIKIKKNIDFFINDCTDFSKIVFHVFVAFLLLA